MRLTDFTLDSYRMFILNRTENAMHFSLSIIQ